MVYRRLEDSVIVTISPSQPVYSKDFKIYIYMENSTIMLIPALFRDFSDFKVTKRFFTSRTEKYNVVNSDNGILFSVERHKVSSSRERGRKLRAC